jgi:hypothetical protein
MNLESFRKIKADTRIHHFSETIAVIEHYDFEPTAFENGIQHNAAGENSGSCKYCFCRNLQELTQKQL